MPDPDWLFRFESDQWSGVGKGRGERGGGGTGAPCWPVEGAAKNFEKQILKGKSDVQDLTNVGGQQ